jgi:nitrate/nitrite transporter NarK
MGSIIDRFGSKKACLANIAMLIIVITISIYQITYDKYGIVSYITCFIWGFQDGIVNTHCM